ncbi:MAG: mucoidy inhibitor MuiA family protein [Pedobacter sp.]
MFLLRTLLLLIFVMAPAFVGGTEINRLVVIPRITAVTVYPDRAMTTRTAMLSLKPGNYVVAFEALPTLIQDDSVRISGKGSAASTILGLEIKRSFVEQTPEKRAKELEEDILTLERKVGSLDAKKAALAAQKSFIDSIKVAWGERISKELAVGKPTSIELNEALTFVGSGVTRVEEQTRDLDFDKQQLKDRINALRLQRDQAIGSHRMETKTVEVSLEVTREGSLTLNLNSVLPQAGWEPSYDVRLNADGKTAELTFRALVRQQTGEDWQAVDLSLSTSRPAVGGTPPELFPWRVAFYRPQPPMQMSVMSSAPGSAYKKAARASFRADTVEEAAETEAPATYGTAQVAEEQTSVSFIIPRKVDILSDGTQHGCVVAIENMPLTLEFLAVPKLAASVYLKSEIINRAGFPLLAGRVNIFTGDNFSGSSQLKKVAVGEKFDLYFGVDDQVTVKREELKSHKEAGLFGKNRMSYRYRIEVQNFRKEAQTMIVRDQLPLAGDDEITVALDEPSLKPDEIKSDGVLTWKLYVKPGEKREISFGIIIEYPKDREISGL